MDIYEISSESEALQGVFLRDNLRKTGKKNNINLKAENFPDNKVRFYVPEGTDIKSITEFLKDFKPTAKVKKIL